MKLSFSPFGIYRQSENGWGWKELLEAILSKCLSSQTGPSKAMCLGPLFLNTRLQGWRLHILPGQPVPGPHHPHSEKSVLMFEGNLLCFSVCPLPLVLRRAQLEIAWFYLLYIFPSCNGKIPLSLLFSWLELLFIGRMNQPLKGHPGWVHPARDRKVYQCTFWLPFQVTEG